MLCKQGRISKGSHVGSTVPEVKPRGAWIRKEGCEFRSWQAMLRKPNCQGAIELTMTLNEVRCKGVKDLEVYKSPRYKSLKVQQLGEIMT